MPDASPRYKPEQIAGLVFVLALHGAVLYGLWSYRILPAPTDAITLMVNLINPPPPEHPEPPKPEPPKPRSPKPVEPPKPQQLVAEAPVTIPDEPVVYAPPPPPPPPVAVTAPLPPVVLTSNLAVSCPERSPPGYPMLSKRMNEQGKVVLRVELDTEGRIGSAAVKASSGFQRLDDAALNAVKAWHCKPAMRNGEAVRAVALQPFNFSLVEN